MPRIAISNDERKALRQWFKSQRPKPRQSDAIEWFEKKHSCRIRQSTKSESISQRFTFLDNKTGLSAIYRSFRQ